MCFFNFEERGVRRRRVNGQRTQCYSIEQRASERAQHVMNMSYDTITGQNKPKCMWATLFIMLGA